jgi:hypothetical protein
MEKWSNSYIEDIRVKTRPKITITALFVASLFFTHAQVAQANWLDKLAGFLGSDPASNEESAPSSASSILSNEDISQAFKQALELGSKKVVSQLGEVDAFNGDSQIHIPLPENMQTVKKWLDKVGLGGSLEDLEVSLNRAAEKAAPQAKELFISTIQQMSFDDVKTIYNGPDDAATRYFQEKMTPALSKAMAPVVKSSLEDVGAVKLYDSVMGEYESIPFVPDVKGNLIQHVVDGGLNGIFHYLAKEEAEIRKNPVKHTTTLLKRVFGK